MILEEESLDGCLVDSSYESDKSHLVHYPIQMWDIERGKFFYLCPEKGVVINQESKIKEEYYE